MGENKMMDIQVLIYKANEYFDMGDYKKAEKLFGDLINNTSLEIDSSIIEAILYQLGLIYIEYYENSDEAKSYFEKIIKRNPKNASGYIGLGMVYNFNQEYNNSVEVFKIAMNLDKENFGSYANIAMAYRHLNKKEEAIHNFLKAIELAEKQKNNINQVFTDKHISNIKFNLGCFYLDIKEFDNAIFYLKQVVKENQLDFESYGLIARAFLFKKDYKEAEKYANISLNIRENNDAFFVLEEIENLENQKIEEYIILLEKEFEKDNNNTELMFKLAESYIHTENFNKAIKLLDILILNNENLSENILRLGFCYYKIQDYDKSIYYYEKALNFENVMVGEIYMMISSSYSNKNDFEPALKYAKLALNTDSTNTEFLLNIGIILYENKKYRDSISYLLKIIKLDNYDIDANIYLSKNYIELLKYNEAEILLIKLVNLEIDNWEVYYLLAKINYKKSNFKTAYDFIEKSLELNPENKKINKLYDDISVKHKTHKKNKIKSTTNKQTNKYNFDIMLLMQKAIDYEYKGNYDEAIKIIQNILHLEPNYTEAYNSLGIIYGKQHDYLKSIAYFEKSIDLDKNQKEVYNNLGNVYKDLIQKNSLGNKEELDENDYKNAISNYLKAIEIDKNYVSPYNGLGMIYRIFNKYEDALKCYNMVLELNPDYKGIYNNIANLYLDMGDNEKSLIYYEKALKYNPDIVNTYFNLASFYVENKPDKVEEIIKYLDDAFNLAVKQNEKLPNIEIFNQYLRYFYGNKLYDKFIDIIEKSIEIIDSDYKLFILYELIYFLDLFIINNIHEIHRKKLENIIKITFTEFFNSNKYRFIHSALYKNADIWINIKFITFFTFFNIITDEPIKNKTIFEELSKDLDDRNINKILNNPIYSQLENDFIERLSKFKDDNKINLLQQKLLFIEMIQLNFKNTIMQKYEETLDEYKKLYNISEIYLIISTELQEELQKENKKHDEYRKNLMQAVSHTLGNLLLDQKTITKFLKNDGELEKKVKKLMFFQEITSSLLASIKIAFGGMIENNIKFYNLPQKNRISLKSVLYFSLNINIDKLLKRTPIWEPIYDSFFEINNKNQKEIKEKKKEYQSNDDFNILELSDNEINKFTNLFNSEYFNLINKKFNLNLNGIENIYMENDSYTFAIVFTILQELIYNIFKYGLINEKKVITINTATEDNYYVISLSNYVSNENENENNSGTLRGLEMIKMFANILGGFEKNIVDDTFSIKIKIKKELFTGENNENIMG